MVALVEISQNVTIPFTITCDYIWEYLQLQDQLSTILVIFTTMMQLL